MPPRLRNVLRLMFIVGLPAALPVFADSVSLSPVADTALFNAFPNNNMGSNANVAAGATASGAIFRAMVKFDLAGAIPAGATVDSVSLELRDVSSSASFISSNFELHRLLADWGEGTGTGNQGRAATNGEATWNSRFHNVAAWSAPGGATGVDFATNVSSSAFISVSGALTTWSSSAEMIADVQFWLDTPSSNFGWALLSDAEGTLETARRFASREDTMGRGPKLTVQFTPVPEPAPVALLASALAAVAMSRRRP